MNWLDVSNLSNKWNQSYVQGFMDISGPRSQLRNGNFVVSDNNFLPPANTQTTANVYIQRNVGIGTLWNTVYTFDHSRNVILNVSGNTFISKNLEVGVNALVDGQLGVGTLLPAYNALVDISGISDGSHNLILRTGKNTVPNYVSVQTYDNSAYIIMTTSVSEIGRAHV